MQKLWVCGIALAIQLAVSGPGASASCPPQDWTWCPSTSVTLDVLVVYPRSFFKDEYSESQIKQVADNDIAQANQIFCNSRIRASYHLAGVVPLVGDGEAELGAQQPPPNVKDALNWMTHGGLPEPRTTNPAAEVAALREAFAADIVVMYIPQPSAIPCGAGNMPLPGGAYISGNGTVYPSASQPPWNNRAFSVLAFGCGGFNDFTFAHEIGHNFGLDHHESQDQDQEQKPDYSGPLLFPNGRGFLTPEMTPRATLMACNWDGVSCHRVPYFSDPDPDPWRPDGLQYVGAIGDSQHNDRRAACDQVGPYSSFKTQPQVFNPPPVPSFTFSCDKLHCIFNGTASTDDQGSPALSWDIGFGETSTILTGNIVSFDYPRPGTRRVHLVAKDGQGKTAVRWQTIQVISQSRPPTGYVDGYNAQHVWGWACDPDYFEQSNRVDVYSTSGQYLGSEEANRPSGETIKNICGDGYAHYFDFYHNGRITPGMHFNVWSIDLPYATPNNDNRQIGGVGASGTEFVMPASVSQAYLPTGWVDGYNQQHIWGWACDPDYPTQSNRVDFYNMSWQYLGSATANKPSSSPINSICRGGSAHYFDFYHYGQIAPGTHFMVWSIDLPYSTAGNVNRRIGGSGSVNDGLEFVMP
jgi:hypothetical protein